MRNAVRFSGSRNFLFAFSRLPVAGWVMIGGLTACSTQPVRTPASQETAPEAAFQKSDLNGQHKENESNAPQGSARDTQAHTEASAEYHFAMAQAYVSEGNPDRAIEEYKLTLMFDPDSSLVYARLATEYVKKGMLSAAMEACKEALQRDPNFIDSRMMLAGLYSTSHETDAALTEYDRVLKSDPRHEEAIVFKSQALIEASRAPEAVRALQQFTKANSDSALAWYYLGRAQQHQKKFPEAVVAYKKAIEARSSFTQAFLALGYLYEERRQNIQAIQVYKSLYDESQDLTAANRLATIFLKEEKYQQAVPYLESIQANDPEDMNVRVKLGLIQMELKQWEKAITMFKEILAKNPDSDRIHYYLGSLYEETKQFDQAVAELKQIKPDSKLYTDSALHVAYLMKQAGHLPEAKTFIQEAIAKSPKVPSFYIFSASMEEETKNVTGAVTILENAVKNFPEDEKVRYYLGSLYDRQGEIDKGLEQMEEILRLNAQNVDALNYIGYTWTQKGIRLNDAEKLIRKALGLRPDNGYIQDSWGWHLYVRGRVKEAVVELEKAARMKPNEPTILEHLGDAYLRNNLREKALQQYQDAAKYADDTDAKKKIETKLENLRSEIAGGGKFMSPGETASRVPAGVSEQPESIPAAADPAK